MFKSSLFGAGKDPSSNTEKGKTIDAADTFFGMPALQEQIQVQNVATQCAAGCLALRVPDLPTSAPPAVVNISKDGKIAAVGGKDVELFLWSTETGELLSTLRGHETSWTGSNDNSFFVTVQEDSNVVVYDSDPIQMRQLLGHPDEALTCCSISLDDMFVIVGGADGSIYSWDAETGSDYRQYDCGHDGPVATAMCYPMPDGSHVIISCGKDHKIVVWDLETIRQLYSIEVTELGHAKNVGYHISRDHIQVLAWCMDSVPFPNLVFIDPLSGNRNSVYCHDGLIRSAMFTKSATKIVSCGSEGKIIVWNAETLEIKMELLGHEGSVLSISVNEEGSRIISCGEDATIRVWNAEDGALLRIMMAQKDPVKFCSYAKSAADTKIITCDVAGRVHVWSTVVEVMNSLLRRFADDLSCITTTSDNMLLAAGCNNGRVMLWDTVERENIWEYSHHTGRVEAIAFNTLRSLLVTCGADGRVVLVYVNNGKQAMVYDGSHEPVMHVSFSPDDERIAGVSMEGKIVVFETDSTDPSPKLSLETGAGRATSFCWAPNSKTIIGACNDGSLIVWSSTSGSVYSALNGEASVTCLSVDLVGKVLAAGNVLGRTVLYILETQEVLYELRSNPYPVREVVFNQETTRITTMCTSQAITWDAATGHKLRVFDFVVDKNRLFKSVPDSQHATFCHWGTILFDHESEIAVFDMVPLDDPLLRSHYLSETRSIVSGNTGVKRIMVWSAADNPVPDKLHTTHDAITSCHFSADDRLLAVGTQDGSIVVYDVMHSKDLEVIPAHQNGPCRCVRMSHDGQQILSCGADAKVVLWDWRNQKPLRIYSGHFICVSCCDMALQGTRLVSGDSHGMMCVFDKETGKTEQTLPLAHQKGIISVSMSADGSTVASVGNDGKVSIWHVDMGSELMSLAAAIESAPLCCAFSPDDSKLAITESNGNVTIWNVVAGCQWYMIPGAHKGPATFTAWSLNSRNLITSGVDSTIGLWDAESGAPLMKLQMKSGPLTNCTISPSSTYVASGSTTGTLSVSNIPPMQKLMPEPSFLYHWMDTHENKQMIPLFTRLLNQFPYLYNIQDAQGWSLVSHAVAKGSSNVAEIVLEVVPEKASMGLISAIPNTQQYHIQLDRMEEGYSDEEDDYGLGKGGIPDMAQRIMSVSPNVAAGGTLVSMTNKNTKSFIGKGPRGGSFLGPSMTKQRNSTVSFIRPQKSAGSRLLRPMNGDLDDSSEDAESGERLPTRAKSFSAQVKRMAVKVLAEKRPLDNIEQMMNNALAMALNSKSSKCVQMVLDATTMHKVSWGSFHAITDMMPSLAVRYPFMCYRFLADLDLMPLGDLEVPVAVMMAQDASVIRTAPIFTNIKNLWKSHLQLHQVRHGPQPYAHVKANMVRLPYACSIGPDSLLHSLVESDVPVQAFGSPTIQAVVRHKWRLYARTRLVIRASIYLFYALANTVFAILYSKEDHTLTLPEYWESGPMGRFHIICTGYLILQALWYLWVELRQMWAVKFILYFKSGWNTLDLVSILMMIVIGVLHLVRVGTDPSREDRAVAPMLAFELLLNYFKVFFYALAFEPTGPVVHALFQLMFAVRNWAVLLFMNIVSFGAALQVLSQVTRTDDQHENFGRSIFSLWQSMFGQFDLSHMLTDDGAWPEVSIVFFSGFLFVANIVLLNMLIVMMREIYVKVRETEHDVFLRGRAELIVEVETLMSKSQRERYSLMPPFLHLLSQVQRNFHSGDSVMGRLGRLEESLANTRDTLMLMMRNLAQGRKGHGDLLAHHYDGEDGGGGDGGEGRGMHPRTESNNRQAHDSGEMRDPEHAFLSLEDQMDFLELTAQRVKESESQLPAVLRQVDRLQRSVNNQEMRMEGMVIVLRDIENLLRNQQPVVVHQETRQPAKRSTVMTEAELEQEVKRLLGRDGSKL